MDVKTESRLLLTALVAMPLIAGIISLFSGDAPGFGLILIIMCLLLLFAVWQPARWFQKK